MQSFDNFKKDYEKYFLPDNGLSITFEMGTLEAEDDIINEVLLKYNELSNFILAGKSFWLVIILWESTETMLADLEKVGFYVNNASQVYDRNDKGDVIFHHSITEKDNILYLQYEKYDFHIVEPLISGIASYEIGVKPSVGVTAYCVSFDVTPVFLNLYDDRGLELLLFDKDLYKSIETKFSDWILPNPPPA